MTQKNIHTYEPKVFRLCCLDSISTSMQVRNAKQVILTKAFSRFAFLYFFVNNPVLVGTIALKGNAAIQQTIGFERILHILQ